MRYFVFEVNEDRLDGTEAIVTWSPVDQTVEADSPWAAIKAVSEKLGETLAAAVPVDQVTTANTFVTRNVEVVPTDVDAAKLAGEPEPAEAEA